VVSTLRLARFSADSCHFEGAQATEKSCRTAKKISRRLRRLEMTIALITTEIAFSPLCGSSQ
jgi:hypothetical protein